MDWDRIRIFYSVATAGSFTKAGEQLNLSQSAISRQISTLEESLGVTLFHRHARGLVLTEQGNTLYRTAKDVFAKLRAAENALADSKDRPQGPLIITTTVAFGTMWLTPLMREFTELHPTIQVSVIADDHELDLHRGEADVAIRFHAPTQQDLIQRHLMSVHSAVYASNDYLRKYGVPQKAKDLDKHRIIVYSDEPKSLIPNVNWLLNVGAATPREPIFRVNNLFGILKAVESGMGIATLPPYMLQGVSGVTRILDNLAGPTTEAYFVYPRELQHSKPRRIAAFRDFILRKVAEVEC
ncbi:MAG: LysR family transcriptional regulator [Alphaproteobacteria bacterium]|nr:LysR family transcriptional regulator [Alphaproteobacteria bacterium]